MRSINDENLEKGYKHRMQQIKAAEVWSNVLSENNDEPIDTLWKGKGIENYFASGMSDIIDRIERYRIDDIVLSRMVAEGYLMLDGSWGTCVVNMFSK